MIRFRLVILLTYLSYCVLCSVIAPNLTVQYNNWHDGPVSAHVVRRHHLDLDEKVQRLTSKTRSSLVALRNVGE